MATEDLTPWLHRVKKAASRAEVFSILDEFRRLEWTDQQCASMSKLYMRVLERVQDTSASQQANNAAAVVTEDSGPVWYEKM